MSKEAAIMAARAERPEELYVSKDKTTTVDFVLLEKSHMYTNPRHTPRGTH